MEHIITHFVRNKSMIKFFKNSSVIRAFTGNIFIFPEKAFTLVEMLMALLIVSVILSASMPIITSRTKAASENYSKYNAVPIGMIAMWKVDGSLPDNTWLEANGQVIPNGIEYEECRRIFGARLPDLRGADNEFYTNLNNYLSKDIKEYLQNAIKPIPQNLIAIWGTTTAIPEGWSEATEYRGVFLRGYGSLTHTQNNGSTIGNTATTHSSGAIGSVQGDAVRNE